MGGYMVVDRSEEKVVLVDDDDRVIGEALKREVHTLETPLHRGFSVFIFKEDPSSHKAPTRRSVLVQQRAEHKQTWPGSWSNSCCGHPAPGESYTEAVERRVQYELGIGLEDLSKVSDYRYRFERDGVVENEICPVFVAWTKDEVQANPDEVADYAWVGWEEWLEELNNDTENKWSEWCKEEALLVVPSLKTTEPAGS